MEARTRDVTDSVIDTRHHLTCEVCGGSFKARRRDARHCSPACTQRAYRLRHPAVLEVAPLHKRLPKDFKIYQCPQCEERYLGQQRCDDCGTFCVSHRAGRPVPAL